jgi:hypothetical protein
MFAPACPRRCVLQIVGDRNSGHANVIRHAGYRRHQRAGYALVQQRRAVKY